MSHPKPSQTTPRRVTCRVRALQQFNHAIMQVLLQPESPAGLDFHAGQYINIVLDDDRLRPFSLASAPREDNLLELHIRHNAGGRVAAWLQQDLAQDTRVQVEGPYGDFHVQDSERPMIMIAGGTGFAPIKSLVEQLIAQQCRRTLYLYWGARTREDLYLENLAQRWGRVHDNIHFIPVVSEESPQATLRGGLVHEAVLEDFAGLADYEVYICGPAAMIQTARQALLRHGLREDAIFSDMFAFLDND